MGILGVAKVNTKNKIPIRQNTKKAIISFGLKRLFDFLNKIVSTKKTAAAHIKNIVIFTKSGDLPKTPL